jgi:predicted ATP-dependent endonuclease of OLD family
MAEKETIFVGANNSGKTSAMDCLISFFRDKKNFTTQDFTLSNWMEINQLGNNWEQYSKEDKVDDNKLFTPKLQSLSPQVDIWINVEGNEIHYVNRIIPTLDWNGGLLGIRLIFEPKSIETLYIDYVNAKNNNEQLLQKSNKGREVKIWPVSLWDFLQKKLHSYFTINAYILDPAKFDTNKIEPQILSKENVPLDFDPFHGLVKIDIINAQRGFSDPNSPETNIGSLSSQLREYYSKHINPTEDINISDLDALEAIDNANKEFDKRLKVGFSSSIEELQNLNYPGFGNPEIIIASKVNPMDGLKHDSAVQFNVLKEDGKEIEQPLKLSEKHNGLGYQNLISMVFKLIRFRDEWMKIGKIAKSSEEEIEPLHIVLIEEPEAHLHAQVQQVFIRKAYEVLRNHPNLKDNKFSTQLIVSTHSSHIAHECDFKTLRYFKRNNSSEKIPVSTVVNLSKTFGSEDDTIKFAIRYLKTTHCDLFFADAAILIEGQAERILLPFFIRQEFPQLTSSYISLLEIGGSHAHRLKPLIEDLGIITLIVTDIDSIDPKNSRKSVIPEVGKEFVTNNSTLKTWIPCKEPIDQLINTNESDKQTTNGLIRAAYQHAIDIEFEQKITTVIPYTFEEALVFENKELFEKLEGNGYIKKFSTALAKQTLKECLEFMFETIKSDGKAQFALDLLLLDTCKLKTPKYIFDGLTWLTETLSNNTNRLNV